MKWNPFAARSRADEPAGAALRLNDVLPRLKTPAFLKALREANIPHDQLPITRSWEGHLLVAYALDQEGSYRFVNHQAAADAGLGVNDLHEQSLKNLDAACMRAGFDIIQDGPIYRVQVGDDLAAVSVLDEEYWDRVATDLGGRALFVLPHRDVLCFGPASDDAIDALQRVIVASNAGDTHSLSPHLFLRQNGSWQVFGR